MNFAQMPWDIEAWPDGELIEYLKIRALEHKHGVVT